jgi:hypothetical protein
LVIPLSAEALRSFDKPRCVRGPVLARSGTNQRLDSAPWFDVGTA